MNLNLEVSVEEGNLILEALGQLPFIKVYTLIGKVQQQARLQLPNAPSRAEGSAMFSPVPANAE